MEMSGHGAVKENYSDDGSYLAVLVLAALRLAFVEKGDRRYRNTCIVKLSGRRKEIRYTIHTEGL